MTTAHCFADFAAPEFDEEGVPYRTWLSDDERCSLDVLFLRPGGACLAHDYEDDHADDEGGMPFDDMERRVVRPCAPCMASCG